MTNTGAKGAARTSSIRISSGRYGLTEKEALRAATILPARFLGLDDRIGSIEVGKDADLVIWDGEPLDFYGSVRVMLIEGKRVELS